MLRRILHDEWFASCVTQYLSLASFVAMMRSSKDYCNTFGKLLYRQELLDIRLVSRRWLPFVTKLKCDFSKEMLSLDVDELPQVRYLELRLPPKQSGEYIHLLIAKAHESLFLQSREKIFLPSLQKLIFLESVQVHFFTWPTSLRHLQLMCVEIRMSELVGLTNLEYLSLDCCDIKVDVKGHLPSRINLMYSTFEGEQINRDNIQNMHICNTRCAITFSDASHMQTLVINCHRQCPNFLFSSIPNMKHLTCLQLGKCAKHQFHYPPNLTTLITSGFVPSSLSSSVQTCVLLNANHDLIKQFVKQYPNPIIWITYQILYEGNLTCVNRVLPQRYVQSLHQRSYDPQHIGKFHLSRLYNFDTDYANT